MNSTTYAKRTLYKPIDFFFRAVADVSGKTKKIAFVDAFQVLNDRYLGRMSVCNYFYIAEGSVRINELNIIALEELVNYAMDKDIPYFAINVPNDMCTNCGYTDEINDKCPMCDCPNIKRLRRVTGYLTGDYTTAFNKGKQQEVEMRVKHE